MPRPTRLNERQVAVLQRICDNTAPVTSADSTLANTVYALRSRGLVTTAWADGRWSASPTEAGLRQAHANSGESPPPADPSGQNRAGASDPLARQAAELVAELERVGGTLAFRDPDPAERARLRRALHAARAADMVPADQQLRLSGRNKGDVVIRLVPREHPAQAAVRDESVAVPVTLAAADVHPAVRDAALAVCPDCQDRARRILHALATAAQRNGFAIDRAAPQARAILAIIFEGSVFPLALEEGSTQVLDPDSAQYTWQRVTAHTAHPTHQLDLYLVEASWAHQGRRHRWGDRKRWKLEDQLPHVLREIGHRAQAERDRQLAKERKEQETLLAWQAAKDRARREFLEAHRLEALHQQVAAWDEAVRIRAYCDALEEHLEHLPADVPQNRRAIRKWITWARGYAERTNPIPGLPQIPENPPIGPEELRPYLRGWSPHEPRRR